MKRKLPFESQSWNHIWAPLASALVSSKIESLISHSSYAVNLLDDGGYEVVEKQAELSPTILSIVIFIIMFLSLWIIFEFGLRKFYNFFFNNPPVRHTKDEYFQVYNKVRVDTRELIKDFQRSDSEKSSAYLLYYRDVCNNLSTLHKYFCDTKSQDVIRLVFTKTSYDSAVGFENKIPIYEYLELLSQLESIIDKMCLSESASKQYKTTFDSNIEKMKDCITELGLIEKYIK